jgi:hypothetical protein
MTNTLKFSEFISGGNLVNSDTTVGINGGLNAFFNNPWTFLPPGDTASRPIAPAATAYQLRFNTDTLLYEYYNSVASLWVEINTTAANNAATISTLTYDALVDFNYVINCLTGQSVVTLPAVCSFGDTIFFQGYSAGGFQIVANTGQQIIYGNLITTMAGNLASVYHTDNLQLMCISNNSLWTVQYSTSTGLAVS